MWRKDEKFPPRVPIVFPRAKHDLPSVRSARPRTEKLSGQVATVPFDGKYICLSWLGFSFRDSGSETTIFAAFAQRLPAVLSGAKPETVSFSNEGWNFRILSREMLLPAIAMQGRKVFTVVVAREIGTIHVEPFQKAGKYPGGAMLVVTISKGIRKFQNETHVSPEYQRSQI